MVSEYQMVWIPDTVKADGVGYLRKNAGGAGKVLLMVYMVTAGSFTKRVVQAYKGDTIVVVGTMRIDIQDSAIVRQRSGLRKRCQVGSLLVELRCPASRGRTKGCLCGRDSIR